jgi:hypothetical protein
MRTRQAAKLDDQQQQQQQQQQPNILHAEGAIHEYLKHYNPIIINLTSKNTRWNVCIDQPNVRRLPVD